MNLFGAATSGVDPQSGSYLSKEQRIAMFNASRGRSSYGSGGSGTGASSGARVSAQSSIVAVNKMAAITQTLQNNYQNATNTVSEQVAKNSKDIQNLYRIVYEQRKDKLKVEQKETEFARQRRGNFLRSMREKMVEGISSSVALAAKPLQNAASFAGDKLQSLWDKIKSFLLRMAGAWVFANLPEILVSLQNFGTNIGNLFDVIKDSPTSIRGIGSIIGKIVSKATDIAINLGKKAYSIADEIWKASKGARERIGRALKGFVDDTIEFLKNRLGSLYRGAKKLFERVLPRAASSADDVGRRALPPAKNALQKFISNIPIPRWMSDTGKGIKNAFGSIGNATQKGLEGLKNAGSSIKDNLSMLTRQADTSEAGKAARDNWLKKALKPVTQALGSDGLERIVKMATRAPVVGAVIDTLLNAGVEGQSLTEAIMRGVLSGGAGAMGWTGGAYVGSGIGFALGSVVPVVGNAAGALIGGALGGIIGSMALGAAGDKLGAIAYEGVTGNKSTKNEGTEAILGLITNPFGDNTGDKTGTDAPVVPVEPVQTNENVSAQISSTVAGRSTPDGMFMPEGEGTSGDVTNFIDMPPEMTQIPMGNQGQQSGVKYQDAPTISTSDSEMDFYRSLSMKSYDLVYTGG